MSNGRLIWGVGSGWYEHEFAGYGYRFASASDRIKMMEEATEGRVTAKIKYKLGSPPAQFDLIQDGVADITWIFHGYNPGRYVATKVVELPGYAGSAKAASIAYWKAHQKFSLSQ